MTDARPGQPPLSEAIDLVPCGLVLVAALTKNAAPEIDDMVGERRPKPPRCWARHGTGNVQARHGPATCLFGSGCIHPLSKLRLDGPAAWPASGRGANAAGPGNAP